MAVYVDDMRAQFRNMIMCHMVADTLDELHQMADQIGIQRKWFQSGRHPHYDICLSKRAKAIRFGAKEITQVEAVNVIRRSQGKPPLGVKRMSEETTNISKNPKDWIWVERYRPSNIDDYICTGEFRARIDEWVNGENNSHLFFESGMPGTGKTTLAKIIASTISSSILFINASMDNGIDTIRNKVAGFVSRKALDGRKKVVILDEIDNMSAGAIRSLRSLIELYVGHVRFIVTCNDWSQAADEKTRAAFKNRFSFVDFSKVHGSSSEERKEVAMDMFNMAVSILEENEVEYEPEAIAHIIKHNFSGALSFRGVIQELQDYAARGVTMATIAGSMELELTEILEKVHKRDLKPVREFVHANANRGTAIIGELERNVDKYFDIASENFLNVFFILRECLDRLKNCDLPEIPLTCMFLELGAENVLHSSIAGKTRGKKG